MEPHPLDVTDDESVRALVDHVEHGLGGADVLVNNAGLVLDENGDVLEVDVQHFRDCMETNVYGPLRLAQALMPGMIARGYGRVVNVSSGTGQLATMSDYAPPYSLSKAALNALTRLLKSGANLILLDEPTNDLDVNSIRALEEGLENFAGCAVVISHDRWFLDRIATHILDFEGNSEVVWFEGNYQAYIEDLKRRKGPDADQPHRIAYRKLVRA